MGSDQLRLALPLHTTSLTFPTTDPAEDCLCTEPDEPLVFRASSREVAEAFCDMQIREEISGLSMYQSA